MEPIIIKLDDFENDEKEKQSTHHKNSSNKTENFSQNQNETQKNITNNSINDFEISTNSTDNESKKNIIIEKISQNPSIHITNQEVPDIKNLEILKQLENIKRKKKLFKIAISLFIIFFLIGIGVTIYYYRIQIANILYPPKIQKHSEKIIQKVEIKLKEIWLIEKEKIKKNSLAEKYYPIYKDDFLLIYNSPLPEDLKKKLLIKLNLLMYRIIKENDDYFNLKLQFNKFEIKMLNLLKNRKK